MKRVLKKYFKVPPRETFIIYAVGAGIILTLFLVLYLTVGKSLTAFVSDTDSFKQWLDSYNGLSAAVFVFIRAFQTVIKIIPAEPLEIASGYAFGTFGGLALCSLGSFLGSLVIVMLSRFFGAKFVNAFINEEQINQLKIISDKNNQRLFLIVFYLIPGTPKDIFTYIAGTLKINLVEFFVITTLARIPSIITSTICGAQISEKNYITALIVFLLTAFVTALCTLAYKKYNDKQKNPD
ncbi:MAG: VTT domain-containing protein [Eubacteriales bacterium]|nr:VTT domain-containing protein [Eubacteriales bacterium]